MGSFIIQPKNDDNLLLKNDAGTSILELSNDESKLRLAQNNISASDGTTAITTSGANVTLAGTANDIGTVTSGTFQGTVTTSNAITVNNKIISGGGSVGTITREVNTSIGETFYEAYRFFSGAMTNLQSGDNFGLFQIVFDGTYGNGVCELATVGTVNNNSPGNPDRRLIHFNNSSSVISAGNYGQIDGTRMRVTTTTTSAPTNGIRIIADSQTTSGTGYFTTYIKVFGGGFNSGSYGITLTVL